MASTGRGDNPIQSTWSPQAPIRKPVVDGSDGVAAKAVWTDWFFEAAAGGSFTSTATWEQAPASWAATSTETFAASASYVQVAATWAAVASQAFTATGSFTQAAAAWSAIATETFTSTATWEQATATWGALMAATGAGLDFTATWDQAAASWASEVAVPTPPVTDMGGWARVRQQFTIPDPEPIRMTARFHQASATWRVDMTTDDDDIALGLTEDDLLRLVPA